VLMTVNYLSHRKTKYTFSMLNQLCCFFFSDLDISHNLLYYFLNSFSGWGMLKSFPLSCLHFNCFLINYHSQQQKKKNKEESEIDEAIIFQKYNRYLHINDFQFVFVEGRAMLSNAYNLHRNLSYAPWSVEMAEHWVEFTLR
jgi:hypothetical protein